MKGNRIVFSEILFMFVSFALYSGSLLIFTTYPYHIPLTQFEVTLSILLIFIYIFIGFVSNIYNLDSTKYSISMMLTSIGINVLFILVVTTLFYARKIAVEVFVLQFLFQNGYKYALLKIFSQTVNLLYISEKSSDFSIKLKKEKMTSYCIKKKLSLEDDQALCDYFLKNPRDFMKANGLNGIVIDSSLLQGKWEKVALKLKFSGVRIYKTNDFYELINGKVQIDNLNDAWFLKTDSFTTLNSCFYNKFKYGVALVFAVILFVLTLPIILFFALCIKIESKGPAFFVQERMGYRFKPFKIFKLRSMYIGDDTVKATGKEDTRITRVGKFIRKTRIDELPQLLNIIKGDMAFIGPRSEWIKLHTQYQKKVNEYYYLRYLIKPGLTGWAQVNFHYTDSLEGVQEKFAYDLYYIKHATFSLDVLIFIKTISTVLKFKGQ